MQNNDNKKGIVDDFLTDASKIIGDPKFRKLIDLGGNALIVGSLFADKSRTALGLGLAMKAAVGIYNAGGLKEYISSFSDGVVSGLSEDERMKACNRSLELIKGGMVPDISSVKLESKAPDIMDYSDGSGKGVSRISLNTSAETEKIAIKKAVGYVVDEFNKKGTDISRGNIRILAVKKNADNTYSVPIELRDIKVDQFKGSEIFTLGYGKDASKEIPMFQFGKEKENRAYDTKVIPVSMQNVVSNDRIGIRGIIDTSEFDTACRRFRESAVELASSGKEFAKARESQASFVEQFGTGKETGYQSLKMGVKRLSQFKSIDKFKEASSELSGYVNYLEKDYTGKLMRFSDARDNVKKIYMNLVSDKMDKNYESVIRFDAACNQFYQLTKNGGISVNGLPSLEVMQYNYGSAVEKNNNLMVEQEISLRKEKINNSPAIISSFEWGAESFYNTSMSAAKKAAEQAGVPFKFRVAEDAVVKNMVKTFGPSKTVSALSNCSPSCVNNKTASAVVAMADKILAKENARTDITGRKHDGRSISSGSRASRNNDCIEI